MVARHAHLVRRVAPLAIAAGFALSATGASAAGFQFSPVRVNLTAQDRSASVLLTNVDDAPLRVEVEALSWTQRSDGQPVLAPSDAILVFPQLLTIPPHEQRRLRVATTEPPGTVESTYKVTIAEIGAFAIRKQHGANIDLTLQADLPVFVAPAIGRRAAAITSANFSQRTLSFAVANTGTVHFVSKDVRVNGLDQDMRQSVVAELDGGDVLANGKREYRVTLSRRQCAGLRALEIHAKAGDQQLVQTLAVPGGACDR